jgi:hypothetical protein
MYDDARTCKPEIPYHIHKRQSPFHILSQINPVHAFSSYFLKLHLILSLWLRLGLSSGGFLLSGLPTKISILSTCMQIRKHCCTKDSAVGQCNHGNTSTALFNFTEVVYYSHDKWVPVTTTWFVFRLRMEERPPIWCVAENILNKLSRTTDKRWSSGSWAMCCHLLTVKTGFVTEREHVFRTWTGGGHLWLR